MYKTSIWHVRPVSQTSILSHRMIKFKGIRRGANERSTGVLSKQRKSKDGSQTIIVNKRSGVLLGRK